MSHRVVQRALRHLSRLQLCPCGTSIRLTVAFTVAISFAVRYCIRDSLRHSNVVAISVKQRHCICDTICLSASKPHTIDIADCQRDADADICNEHNSDAIGTKQLRAVADSEHIDKWLAHSISYC